MVDTITNATTGPQLVIAFDNNAAALAAAQAQIALLAAAVGNPPANAYVAPSANAYFLYGTAANPWTAATKNGNTASFGSPNNAATFTLQVGVPMPCLTAVAWSYAQKSLLVGYTLTGIPTYTAAATSYGAFRRVALDSGNAPTIVSAELLQPVATIGAYQVGGSFPLVSGVGVSDGVFKCIGATNENLQIGNNWAIVKYTVSWDGSSLTASADGFLASSSVTSNNPDAAHGWTFSSNFSGLLTNVNSWISPGTLNYDLNLLDTGAGAGVSFPNERVSVPTPTHDFSGGGMTMTAITTTTTLDGTARLTLVLQTNDTVSGTTQCASLRISQKTYSGGLSIASFSENAWFVQFTDAVSNRWACVLVYNPSTNLLTLYRNTFYNAANLGAQALGAYGFAKYSATVMYGLRKDAATQAAKLMCIVFNTASAGTELASATANDISLTLCSGIASVTAVAIHGMIQIASDTVVIYGRVTAAGVTTVFVDSFTLTFP